MPNTLQTILVIVTVFPDCNTCSSCHDDTEITFTTTANVPISPEAGFTPEHDRTVAVQTAFVGLFFLVVVGGIFAVVAIAAVGSITTAETILFCRRRSEKIRQSKSTYGSDRRISENFCDTRRFHNN